VTGASPLASPAPFSSVDPLGAAPIPSQAPADRAHGERAALARRVGACSLAVPLVPLWV
jgi:hypothetical protein